MMTFYVALALVIVGSFSCGLKHDEWNLNRGPFPAAALIMAMGGVMLLVHP